VNDLCELFEATCKAKKSSAYVKLSTRHLHFLKGWIPNNFDDISVGKISYASIPGTAIDCFHWLDDEKLCAFDCIAFPKATNKECDESWRDSVLKVPPDCSAQEKLEIFNKMLLIKSFWKEFDFMPAACSAQVKLDTFNKMLVAESAYEHFESIDVHDTYATRNAVIDVEAVSATSENCLATCHDPPCNINLRVILPRNKQSRFPNNLAHAAILGVVTNHLFMRAQTY